MILLRSLAFNLAFYGWTTAIQVVCLPLLLFPRRYTVAGGRIWTRVGLWLLRVLCGVTHEVRGLENLPKEPCILAAKHQSAWDTLVFSQVVGDVGYVVKRELVQIPGFGHYLKKAGVVAVDRKGGAKALVKMIEGARATLAAGRSVVIFPEGTRTAPGETRPYHPGVAALYSKTDAPVVPVALNSGWYWGRQSFLKRPGRIVLEFLPAMEPGLKRREFLAVLERRIEAACAALPKGPQDGRRA